MKTEIIIQGQNLTPDYVNVLRAILVDGIVGATQLTAHPKPKELCKGFRDNRSRLFHVLDVVDGATYYPDFREHPEITISVNGEILDEYDAIVVAKGLIAFHEGSANDTVLQVTGFSVKHFKNLVEVMAVPLLDKVPKATEEEDRIPD